MGCKLIFVFVALYDKYVAQKKLKYFMLLDKTRYNYQKLDQLLTEYLDPQAVGNQLDEIMNELLSCAKCDDSSLEGRYFILRTLRDLFWKLKQS